MLERSWAPTWTSELDSKTGSPTLAHIYKSPNFDQQPTGASQSFGIIYAKDVRTLNMMDGCMWIGGAAPAETFVLRFQAKVLSVASPSSVGLEEGAFVASSVATKSAHAVGRLDASVVVSPVIG